MIICNESIFQIEFQLSWRIAHSIDSLFTGIGWFDFNMENNKLIRHSKSWHICSTWDTILSNIIDYLFSILVILVFLWFFNHLFYCLVSLFSVLWLFRLLFYRYCETDQLFSCLLHVYLMHVSNQNLSFSIWYIHIHKYFLSSNPINCIPISFFSFSEIINLLTFLQLYFRGLWL